jgi:hypothetical protein
MVKLIKDLPIIVPSADSITSSIPNRPYVLSALQNRYLKTRVYPGTDRPREAMRKAPGADRSRGLKKTELDAFVLFLLACFCGCFLGRCLGRGLLRTVEVFAQCARYGEFDSFPCGYLDLRASPGIPPFSCLTLNRGKRAKTRKRDPVAGLERCRNRVHERREDLTCLFLRDLRRIRQLCYKFRFRHECPLFESEFNYLPVYTTYFAP